jgi:hypothetical protein
MKYVLIGVMGGATGAAALAAPLLDPPLRMHICDVRSSPAKTCK